MVELSTTIVNRYEPRISNLSLERSEAFMQKVMDLRPNIIEEFEDLVFGVQSIVTREHYK
jgi:hypothetical protein